MLRCDMLRPFNTRDTLDNNGVCHTMLNHHWPSLSRVDSSSPQVTMATTVGSMTMATNLGHSAVRLPEFSSALSCAHFHRPKFWVSRAAMIATSSADNPEAQLADVRARQAKATMAIVTASACWCKMAVSAQGAKGRDGSECRSCHRSVVPAGHGLGPHRCDESTCVGRRSGSCHRG